MNIVKQILQTKGDGVWSISPEASVFEALAMMAEKEIGALLVIDKGEVAGIFSERDYARKVILRGKSSKDIPVSEVMTRRVLCVNPSTTVGECMALMTEKHIRHLPVMDDGKLAGFISIGDVVKSIISEQEYLIEHLENYIIGR
ncbi:MAG: CBS domain-containing protein [Chloroflexota bacterium]